MLLFRCETYYQLIVIIHLKTTVFKSDFADLILSDLSNFDNYVDKIKSSGLFRNVYLVNDREMIRNFSTLTDKDLCYFSVHPRKFFGNKYEMLSNDYSKVFFGVPRGINILFYNFLLKFNHKDLAIAFFDEGLQSYLNRYISLKEMEQIRYRTSKCKFYNHIESLYLLRGDLFVGNKPADCELITLSPFSDNVYAHQIIREIFEAPLSTFKEKFVFLEEASLEDGFFTNDIDILDMIAEIIGKENIIVKLHPRTRFDRFSIRGYNVLKVENSPFEIFELNGSFDHKVFMSVSSTAVVTEYLLFNKINPVIYLFPLVNIKTHFLQNNGIRKLFYLLREQYNKTNTNMIFPVNKEMLFDALIYMEGVVS